MQVVGIPGDLCDVPRQWILRKRLVALTADARLITFCCGWSFLPIVGRHWLRSALGELRSITAPLPIGERGILRWACLSVCVCVCLSVRDHISGTTRPIFALFFVKCYRLRCALGELRSIIYRHRRRRHHLLHRNAAHIIQNKIRCSSVVCDR